MRSLASSISLPRANWKALSSMQITDTSKAPMATMEQAWLMVGRATPRMRCLLLDIDIVQNFPHVNAPGPCEPIRIIRRVVGQGSAIPARSWLARLDSLILNAKRWVAFQPQRSV